MLLCISWSYSAEIAHIFARGEGVASPMFRVGSYQQQLRLTKNHGFCYEENQNQWCVVSFEFWGSGVDSSGQISTCRVRLA